MFCRDGAITYNSVFGGQVMNLFITFGAILFIVTNVFKYLCYFVAAVYEFKIYRTIVSFLRHCAFTIFEHADSGFMYHES